MVVVVEERFKSFPGLDEELELVMLMLLLLLLLLLLEGSPLVFTGFFLDNSTSTLLRKRVSF